MFAVSRRNWLLIASTAGCFVGHGSPSLAGPQIADPSLPSASRAPQTDTDPLPRRIGACPVCSSFEIRRDVAEFLETLIVRAYKGRPADLAAVKLGEDGKDPLAYRQSIVANLLIAAP